MRKDILLPVFFILLVIISGCKKSDRLDADVSDIDIQLEINRLDKDLFEIPLDKTEQSIPDLASTYGEFFELYSRNIINIGSTGNKSYPEYLQGFLTDYTINMIHKEVMKEFPVITNLEDGLTEAFKHYHYYFPEKQIPALYTYIGGFNQSIIVGDSILAIGTDKYLGSDCEFYDKIGIPKYIQKNMHKEKIIPDCMYAWTLTEFIYNDSIDNLANNMIYQGKIFYVLDALLPDMPDSLKFGFTENQLLWCQGNEKQMWEYLIEEKLLFTTKYLTINRFINPAPYTYAFGNNSPGRAVLWMGRNIVRAYMQKNPEVSMKDLMENDNYQQILSESKYKPE